MYKTLTKRALMTVCGLTAGLLAATMASPVAPAAGASSSGCAPSSADAVVAWNDTASAALGTDAALPAPVMAVGMAYVQAAVYNAVEGIERSHPLYRWHVRGPRCASTAAAVAAAARGVLLHYFPVSSARVESAYADALASIPDGAAKDDGVAYGERAANHLLTQRAGDGWLGTTIFDRPPAPGIWRPTPPLFAPYLAPWLGTMTPFVLRSADQFRPSGPPRLTSATYTRDFQEVAVSRLGDQHDEDARADRDRALLRRQPHQPAAGCLPRPRRPPRYGRRRCRAVRRDRRLRRLPMR